MDARVRLEALGIDLEGSLLDEPRFLTDSAFLGALHAELREELGADAAAAVLTQLGFARGLFDASRLVRDDFAPDWSPVERPAPIPARLPMRLAPARGSEGALAFDGSWPEREESEAVVAALGACDAPMCHASAGYTSGWLSGVFGSDVLALEVTCSARGDDACRFRALEPADWQARGERRAAALLEAVPLAPLRELVARQLASLPERERTEGFEAGSPAIHLWGPVMVVPFAGADESLRALELIGRDRAARGVRAVIIDCSGAIIDEGFGALALERILDAVAGLGAEPILAGVSPLSMGVVRDLERSHAVLYKDLPEAIATAFQIAEAQRGAS
jgi:V4R domain/Activator of aromatic catabolism